jgi:molybdopterin converting factor small subunit
MVRVLIPGPLQPFASGRREIALAASRVPRTVADALRAVGEAHPGIRDRVVTERGELRPHINIFVGPDNIRDAEGLATPVPEGAEISILPAVSGG